MLSQVCLDGTAVMFERDVPLFHYSSRTVQWSLFSTRWCDRQGYQMSSRSRCAGLELRLDLLPPTELQEAL